MSNNRRIQRSRSRRPGRGKAPAAGAHLTTPEGDPVAFMTAHYRHTAMDEILQILRGAGDFGFGDDEHPLEAEPDGSFQIPWYETRPGARPVRTPMAQRVLAMLNLTPTRLEVETMSRQRLDDCHHRLEQLLGGRIRRIRVRMKSMAQMLRERGPSVAPAEPPVLPPEAVAEMEEQMLQDWIEDSIPALDGLTPREAVKTPQGRQQVLNLIDYIEDTQKRSPRPPWVVSPDYRKAKELLGLE